MEAYLPTIIAFVVAIAAFRIVKWFVKKVFWSYVISGILFVGGIVFTVLRYKGIF